MARIIQQRAEILVIGNEILNGTTLDTNSWWLSRQLNIIGVSVERKLTVKDSLATISDSFTECISRKPDWLFSIGGLGPTFDDMTIQGLSRALGKPCKLNRDALKILQESYSRRARKFIVPKRSITSARLKMAKLPAGANPLVNPVGSAPGVLAISDRTHIVSLPGVPSEMKAIFKKEVLPLLLSQSSDFFTSEEWIKTVGVSESQLSTAVARIFQRYGKRELYVKSHPNGYERGRPRILVQIILNARREDKENALKNLRSAADLIERAATKLGARTARSVRRLGTGSKMPHSF